jgi:TetR/AcrR family transcriptional regulator
MPRYPEKRRAALEATLRQEVCRVASEVLREEGMAALTMDRIARQVGVSRATLYNYFADADAVLNFVEASIFEPVMERVRSVIAGNDPAAEKLAAIARAVLDGLYDDRALALAVFAKQELRGPRAEHKMEQRQRFLTLVAGVIETGVAAGDLRPVAPRLAANVFLGALSSFIESMLYAGAFRSSDEIVPGMMDVLLTGLAARPDGG